MLGLSFVAMYLLMYLMVDSLPNVLPNLNAIYMTLSMVSVMALIEILTMGHMYQSLKFNKIIIVTSSFLLVLSVYLVRTQTTITDKEFIRSMIPHHAGALLMCGKQSLEDQELKTLCDQILASQQKEIDQMKTILNRL